MKKNKISRKSGLPPGSLVYTGTSTGSTQITLFVYDDENFTIYENISVQEAASLQGKDTTNWIKVRGLNDPDILQELAGQFGIHALVLEDILNVEHLPKVEELESGIFITLKNLNWSESLQSIDSEQISLFLGANVLISFEEKEEDLFTPLIERLRTGKGRGRVRQEDYLCYLLIDHIVDNYYFLLDHTEDQIEALEKQLIENPSDDMTKDFLRLKKNMMLLRKTVNPLKEEIRYLAREESAIIKPYTQQYLGDINDHLMFIMQSADSFREMIGSMMDLLMANNANRMNSIMKTLTLMSTIFIPLTLLSSIYGMNFEFMPELHWKYGYPVFLGSMLTVGSIMYIYMKKKRWF
jgi:magnesium transporter